MIQTTLTSERDTDRVNWTYLITICEVVDQNSIIDQRATHDLLLVSHEPNISAQREAYHGIDVYIESSSSINNWAIHHRRLKLKGIDIHAVHSRPMQGLRRLTGVKIEHFLQLFEAMPKRQRDVDTERQVA
jgi:hypothetical protein